MLLFCGARAGKFSDPDRVASESSAGVRKVSREITPVLMNMYQPGSSDIWSEQLTVAVSYQCMATASIVQPVQLPKNCCNHSTPPPLVTAGPTSFAFPAKGSILVFQSAAAVVGSMLDCPALSGSLKLYLISNYVSSTGRWRTQANAWHQLRWLQWRHQTTQ